MEIANGLEPLQDDRVHIELINGPFLFEHKGSPADASHTRHVLFLFVVKQQAINSGRTVGIVKFKCRQGGPRVGTTHT